MTILEALSQYIGAIQQKMSQSRAREHAYRPALNGLLDALNDRMNAINDPARIEAGAPDFIVLRGETPVGFVEAKDIDENLARIERTDQMKRYLAALPNLILTDYVEFRWYVNGEHRQTARLGDVRDGKLHDTNEGCAEVARLLDDFAAQHTPTIRSARELATRMAGMTREIRRLIENSLPSSDALKAQKAAFAQTLLPDLTDQQFADMYAQTIAYGLFASRVSYTGNPEGFSLHTAFWNLPKTNPFLKNMFQKIAPDLDPRVRWLVDGLADLLAHADMEHSILPEFGHSTRREDPVVHFYETFLSAYDPALRERRGVYYTPEPVVSYIVRSVDHLLKTHFNRPDGLADRNTLILDPAAGTGTFLYFVIQFIHEALEAQGQLGGWDQYVAQHLLPRLFGFELLVAPYAVAHMKLGIQLQALGYEFEGDQRLSIYLTNTLEQEVSEASVAFGPFIVEEARSAAEVKRGKPIMVVLGNPPYSGHSANKSEELVTIPRGASYIVDWIPKQGGGAEPVRRQATRTLKDHKQPNFIGQLLRDYYFVDEQPLGERNSKWLQNDYVKFIRFAQWKIQETGTGIVAFITANSYLDSPTFRGMRQHLMQTFSAIYILNLNGYYLRPLSPDGSPDKSVFEIQQGVAIVILVKNEQSHGPARIFYMDLWGDTDKKYDWLFEHDLANTEWLEIEPSAPYYWFVPISDDRESEYQQGWHVTDIWPIYSMGITTGDDSEFVCFPGDNHSFPSDYRIKQFPVSFRPFDIRNLYYDVKKLARARSDLMRHLASRGNLALLTIRRLRTVSRGKFFVSDTYTDKTVLSSADNAHVFPLYVYPKPNELISDSPWTLSDKGRRPNLNKDFVEDIAERLGLEFVTEGQGDLDTTFGPEDVFYYAYAVFHSPTYRERYAELLRIDFPRLPLTGDPDLFATLVGVGRKLADLHLMRSAKLDTLTTKFSVKGTNEVASGYPTYDEKHERVYINADQYFEGVPADVWAFYVGGYQVLEKWLKDRRGRALTWDDIQHYQRVVVALKETMTLMAEIDAAIPAWPLA